MTPLGTIPEQSYGELEFPQQQQQQSRSIVKADVHRQQEFAARNASLHAAAAAAAQGTAQSVVEFHENCFLQYLFAHCAASILNTS